MTFNWQTLYQKPATRDEWNLTWIDTYIGEEDLRRMLPFQ
jgi:hypothetical protein